LPATIRNLGASSSAGVSLLAGNDSGRRTSDIPERGFEQRSVVENSDRQRDWESDGH